MRKTNIIFSPLSGKNMLPHLFNILPKSNHEEALGKPFEGESTE